MPRSIPCPSARRYWDSASPDNIRVAASKNYNKEKYQDDMPLKYYLSGNPGKFMHEDTRRKLELLLNMLARDGEAKTMRYIRKRIIPNLKRK